MSRILSVIAVIVTITALGADAFAQGSGMWKPHYNQGRSSGRSMGGGMMGRGMMGRSYSYAPRPSPSIYSQPQAEGYRAFSFEPVGINAGDTVAVNRGDVKLMQGRNVVGEIPEGIQFRVTKVINGWLGAVVDLNGQQQKGWIWNRHVRLLEEAPPTPPAGT
jgi:hypothetical protein